MSTNSKNISGRCVDKEIKYVLFDVDNTLVDSDPLRVAGLTACGHPDPVSLSRAELRIQSQPTLMKAHGGIYMKKYWHVYLEVAASDGQLTDVGLGSVLDRIRSAGIPLGVVTSSPRLVVTKVLELLNVAEYFDGNVVGYGDCPRRKPYGDPIVKGMELIGAVPADTMYVGDLEKDLDASRNANVSFGFAAWPEGNSDTSLESASDYVFKTAEQMLDAIKESARR